MPDIASLLQNPMMMQMAQQMMANGGMERMMQNPAVANMVSASTLCLFVRGILIRPFAQMNRVQNGGQMPSMAEIMADPNLREM